MIEYEYSSERDVKLPLILDSDEMIRVRQHSWGVTTADRENPVLKTQRILYCIGVSLYDRENRVAGLLHMDGFSDQRYSEPWMGPYADIWMMSKAMQRNGANISEENSIEAHIVWNPNFRANLVQTAQGVLVNKFNVQRVVMFPGDTLAVDSRDGRAYWLDKYEWNEPSSKRSNRIISLHMRTPALKTADERSLGITNLPYF